MKTPAALTLLLFVFAALFVLAGCGDTDGDEQATPAAMKSDAPSLTPTTPTTRTREAPARDRPRIVFLGDSLTAGYGLDVDQAFPAVVGKLLAEEGLPIEVVNAGVSGDTTAGGLRRIDWLLRQEPDIVVVGLGGNDGLRGAPLAASEQNLRDIVTRAKEAGAEVLLLGMLIPPNYGPEYTSQFRDLYPRVAEDLDVPRVPFLLEGVGGDVRLNQADRIHPTAEGQQVLARTVLPYLRPLVEQASERDDETANRDSVPTAAAASDGKAEPASAGGRTSGGSPAR